MLLGQHLLHLKFDLFHAHDDALLVGVVLVVAIHLVEVAADAEQVPAVVGQALVDAAWVLVAEQELVDIVVAHIVGAGGLVGTVVVA